MALLDTDSRGKKQGIFKNKIVRYVGYGIGAILIVTVLLNSFTRVEPGYAAVQYSLFGGLKKEVKNEGGHPHLPWINYYQYPISTETVQLRNPKKGEDREDNSLQVNTSGGKSVAADVRYAYKFQKDRLPEIFKRFRRQDAEWVADNYIKQIILDTVQNQTTKHSVLEVYSESRDKITTDVRESLKKTLAEDGIVMEKFTITDVRLDAKTKKILQQVTDAENKKEVLKREQENLTEQAINIEKQKANEKLAAEKDKEIAVVNAQKEAEVKKITAQAEAAANRELAASVSETLVDYEIAKKADKIKWPTVYGGGGNMFQLPAELLQDQSKKK